MTAPVPAASWAPPAWALPILYVLGGGVLGSGTTLSVKTEEPENVIVDCTDSVEALASELSECQMAVYRCAAETPE